MELEQVEIQVCRKGHLINEAVALDPGSNRRFCPLCGSETLLKCPSCSSKIISADPNPYRQVVIPAYCCECGNPLPWTEGAVQAAYEFADELDELDPQDKAGLKAAVPDLVNDTASTPFAISRVQRYFAKIGRPATTAFLQILVSVLSAEAKKQFGLK